MKPILRAENLTCARALPGEHHARVENVSLAIETHSFCVVRGSAGSGRNLLLQLLGLLEMPDAGEVFLHESPTRRLDPPTRAGIRNQHFGFMFAEPFLLHSLSVIENIAMPLLKHSSASTEEARARTIGLLDFIGLPGIGEMPGDQLSRGEQHRVSLARALANHPEVLIAGNLEADLDGAELEEIVRLLQEAVEQFGVTVLLSAAEVRISGARQIEMTAGTIARDSVALMNG